MSVPACSSHEQRVKDIEWLDRYTLAEIPVTIVSEHEQVPRHVFRSMIHKSFGSFDAPPEPTRHKVVTRV